MLYATPIIFDCRQEMEGQSGTFVNTQYAGWNEGRVPVFVAGSAFWEKRKSSFAKATADKS